MAGLAKTLGGINPYSPCLPYRINYEVKQGNSYKLLYDFIFDRKAWLRVDDSTYYFLDHRQLEFLFQEVRKCVAFDDRLSLEVLNPPVRMIAFNVPEVVEWLETYVNGPNAASNRGFHSVNALIGFGVGI